MHNKTWKKAYSFTHNAHPYYKRWTRHSNQCPFFSFKLNKSKERINFILALWYRIKATLLRLAFMPTYPMAHLLITNRQPIGWIDLASFPANVKQCGLTRRTHWCNTRYSQQILWLGGPYQALQESRTGFQILFKTNDCNCPNAYDTLI